MNMNQAAVHPGDALPPPNDGAIGGIGGPRVRVNDLRGTHEYVFFRPFHFVFALISVCLMASTSHFHTVAAFRLIQLPDLLAMLMQGVNYVKLQIISILAFSAAIASMVISMLIQDELDTCAVQHCKAYTFFDENHSTRICTAVQMAFLSWSPKIFSFTMSLPVIRWR
ncbi:hypothetical protein ACFE04_002392 [Oxalis oulophora]